MEEEKTTKTERTQRNLAHVKSESKTVGAGLVPARIALARLNVA